MVYLPSIPETAAYILKNSTSFGFHQLSEDDFAKRARSAIMTRSGGDGRFLTKPPLDFFTSTGGKNNFTMQPGSESRHPGLPAWGIRKGKVGKSRPVVVLDEDYPGIPIDQVATIFEYQARILHQFEADENRAGPSQSKITEYPTNLVSLINDPTDEMTMARVEKQIEMHKTYRQTVLNWLRRKANKDYSRVGFDINKGRVMGTIKPSNLTGMRPDTESVMLIEIDCEKTITRPEVAVALDLDSDLKALEYTTLLCSANSRRMLLYVALSSPEQYGQLITQIKPLLKNLRGSNSKMSARLVKTRNNKGEKADARRTLLPLSLYILPPPPKTSSSTKGMFSHLVTGMGHAIVPILDDKFTWYYDAHPLVAAYNISKYVSKVSNFMKSARLINLEREAEEEDIRIVIDERLAKKWSNHRSRSLNIVEELPTEEPDIAFVLPYGREVLIHAKSEGSTMAGFSDGSIRSGTIHLKQIDALMNKGEDAILYGRLSALPNLDPDLPKDLLSFKSDDWEDSILHIENAYSGKISHLLDSNIVQVKSAKGTLFDVYEDEITNGDAETLGYVLEGKTYYFVRTYRIAATIIALDTTNKRFNNGELGPVIISVMSEERRKREPGIVEWSGSTKTPVTTVYESVGIASSMKGFTVKDRRVLFEHLVQAGTHMDGDYLFIDPYKADTIIEVEFKKTSLKMGNRYIRQIQMERSEERYNTDAAQEAGEETRQTLDSTSIRDVEAVLPVAQSAVFGSRAKYIASDFARLIQIESAVLPQIENAKIVGIRSVIPELDYKVENEDTLTAKTEYQTNEGIVFTTDISLDQFFKNGPEPRIEGNVPSGVEALLTASLNPPVFDSPEAMDMGIAADSGPTKYHNQYPKGFEEQAETIPAIAKNWKKKSFRVELSLGDFLEKYKDDERTYTVSHKIDGDSSMVMFDGEESIIWNHRGRWRKDFHITDEITASLKKAGVAEAMINGELYAVDSDGLTLPLNEVGSIIVSPKTIERQNQIRFTAFDITSLKAQGSDYTITADTPYQERMLVLTTGASFLEWAKKKDVRPEKTPPLLKGESISVVQSWRGIGTSHEVQEAWNTGMKEPNFEGLVFRFDNEAKSIKIKMKGTADLAVIGFYRGKAGGRDEEIIGGGGLAWMLPNGDFVYSGNAVIGSSMVEKKALLEELTPSAIELGGKARWGNHEVDPTKTHMTTGKGTMTAIKPTMIGEFDYRGLNWSEKPIYRVKGKKLVQVGTMRAPTMFQPSFKRWRTDKSITPHDLRMEQVPVEGTGKWGQIQ